jgi:hypothetical protein
LTPMDQNWLAQDATIVDYRRFCDGFRLNGAGR